MKRLLQQNAVFIGLSLVLIIALGLALLLLPKGELHLLLCDRHTPARDIFYKYYTQVGEWFPYALCVLLLLFGRVGDALLAASGLTFSALTTQFFKHIINAPRPYRWFAMNMPDISLPAVEGVRFNEWFSFPSGHTTSFFALAFVACILLTRKPRSTKYPKMTSYAIQVVLFVAAALGAYSRIYLSQHFALDVFAGIVVGIGITLACYAVLQRYEDQKWYNNRLFEKK